MKMKDKNSLQSLIAFYQQASGLKKLVRKGWTLRDVPNPESVADHTFGVSILALIAARETQLDMEKILTMAIIHEICEPITGDITPYDNIPPKEKQRRELEAAAEILNPIDPNGVLLELWKDFEFQRTPEGKLVKELDRLEMTLQARQYEREHHLDLEEFFQFTEEKLETPELKAIFQTIQNSRRGKKMEGRKVGR